MCHGLAELAKQHLGFYCLETGFKAGLTKFKTAAVEYIFTMGLTPRSLPEVITWEMTMIMTKIYEVNYHERSETFTQ